MTDFDGIKRTEHLKGLTKSQRWHMEYFMFQAEDEGYFYIEVGKYKPHSKRTVNSLIKKGLIKIGTKNQHEDYLNGKGLFTLLGAATGKLTKKAIGE